MPMTGHLCWAEVLALQRARPLARAWAENKVQWWVALWVVRLARPQAPEVLAKLALCLAVPSGVPRARP
jgi:hypothetical protein